MPAQLCCELTEDKQLFDKWKKEWASSHTPCSNIACECCTLLKKVLVNQVENYNWIFVINGHIID